MLIILDSGEEGSIHSQYSTVGMKVVNKSQMMMKEVLQSSISACKFSLSNSFFLPSLTLLSRVVDQRLLDLDIDIPLMHLSSLNSDIFVPVTTAR